MSSPEKVTIDGTDIPVANGMPTPAWFAVSLLPLWRPADKRGGNLAIPHSSPSIPLPRRGTDSKRTLQLVIVGDVDTSGAPVTDVREGIEANLAAFKAAFVAPPTTTDGTRSATLHLPSGATKTATITVEDFTPGERSPESVRATFTFLVLGGEFA
jgi:hypothetical protein